MGKAAAQETHGQLYYSDAFKAHQIHQASICQTCICCFLEQELHKNCSFNFWVCDMLCRQQKNRSPKELTANQRGHGAEVSRRWDIIDVLCKWQCIQTDVFLLNTLPISFPATDSAHWWLLSGWQAPKWCSLDEQSWHPTGSAISSICFLPPPLCMYAMPSVHICCWMSGIYRLLTDALGRICRSVCLLVLHKPARIKVSLLCCDTDQYCAQSSVLVFGFRQLRLSVCT